jgi:enoyl-CoA hydratase
MPVCSKRMRDTLTSRRDGDVLVLTLDRPAKRNALDGELCRALAHAVGDADARAIVLTGAGEKAFCAGFDIDALDGRAEAAFDALIDAVTAARAPLVAALNGGAFGGGCELAATCDLRIAHDGVRLAMPPARLGIVYPARGLARLAALAGESRARHMFLTARPVDARTALGWGLVDEVVPAADVLPRALATAAEMATLAPLAVQGMRRTFEALLRQRAAAGDTPEIAGLRHAARESQDLAEALVAFAERRAPIFRGR